MPLHIVSGNSEKRSFWCQLLDTLPAFCK